MEQLEALREIRLIRVQLPSYEKENKRINSFNFLVRFLSYINTSYVKPIAVIFLLTTEMGDRRHAYNVHNLSLTSVTAKLHPSTSKGGT